MNTITLEEFHTRLRSQGVPRDDLAFRCPMCGAVQSARDLIKAGAGNSFDDVEKYLGFSCVGRWLGAGTPRKNPDGKPCNWTLGGLLRCHTLEVRTEDGKTHARFEPATPEEAKEHSGLVEETL